MAHDRGVLQGQRLTARCPAATRFDVGSLSIGGPRSGHGAYLGFSGDESTDQRIVEQQCGVNLDRLRAVKAQYDPENLFRVDNDITPAGH